MTDIEILFPSTNVFAPLRRSDGFYLTLTPCQRCFAWVAWKDRERHTLWHAAVDTATTTQLPSDSAPRSSGVGRPEPKDPR